MRGPKVTIGLEANIGMGKDENHAHHGEQHDARDSSDSAEHPEAEGRLVVTVEVHLFDQTPQMFYWLG